MNLGSGAVRVSVGRGGAAGGARWCGGAGLGARVVVGVLRVAVVVAVLVVAGGEVASDTVFGPGAASADQQPLNVSRASAHAAFRRSRFIASMVFALPERPLPETVRSIHFDKIISDC